MVADWLKGDSWHEYFEVFADSELVPEVIAAVQIFGTRINLHQYLHFLVTESGTDKAGLFNKVSRVDDLRLAELFAREFMANLVSKELIRPDWAERLFFWRHTGFNVRSRIRARIINEEERVGKYMIRPLLPLERLSLDEKGAQVGYRYGKEANDLERMDYLEFISGVISHIPDK